MINRRSIQSCIVCLQKSTVVKKNIMPKTCGRDVVCMSGDAKEGKVWLPIKIFGTTLFANWLSIKAQISRVLYTQVLWENS
jgi:hypothetical protein